MANNDLRLKWGYTPEQFEFSNDYYEVDKLIEHRLEQPVPEGYKRWRCLGCGWAEDFKSPETDHLVPATCCGSCGYALNRPIEEWGGKSNVDK